MMILKTEGTIKVTEIGGKVVIVGVEKEAGIETLTGEEIEEEVEIGAGNVIEVERGGVKRDSEKRIGIDLGEDHEVGQKIEEVAVGTEEVGVETEEVEAVIGVVGVEEGTEGADQEIVEVEVEIEEVDLKIAVKAEEADLGVETEEVGVTVEIGTREGTNLKVKNQKRSLL